MTNYTDEQIKKAILKMPMMNLANYVAQWELELFRQFLDALPDQPDEWEQCRFEDVKDTDLNVRFVFDDGSIIQGKPHMRCLTEIDLWTGYVITQVTMTAAKKGKAEIYRIPRKIVHPDPEEHRIIIVHATKSDDFQSDNDSRSAIWNGMNYTIEGHHSVSKNWITSWEPADVVPKVVEDE